MSRTRSESDSLSARASASTVGSSVGASSAVTWDVFAAGCRYAMRVGAGCGAGVSAGAGVSGSGVEGVTGSTGVTGFAVTVRVTGWAELSFPASSEPVAATAYVPGDVACRNCG